MTPTSSTLSGNAQEGEVYLGMVSFLYHVEKIGIKPTVNIDSITLMYGHRPVYCPIMPGKQGYDCGYVVLNTADFNRLFGQTPVDLTTNKPVDFYQFVRAKRRLANGNREHCKLEPPLRGAISVTLNGKSVNCLGIP